MAKKRSVHSRNKTHKFIFFFVIVSLVGCHPRKGPEQEKYLINMDSVVSQNFFKSLDALVRRYPKNYQGKLAPIDEKNFQLIRSVFIPYLDSLTFNLKGAQKCNGCWFYRFIQIYNNHKNFVIPLTDDEIYWSQSGRNPKLDSTEILNFSLELNNFLKEFDLTDRHKIELILNEIMTLNNCQKISNADLPKLEVIFSLFKKDANQCDSCRLNLDSSLATIKNWLKQDKLAYSSGINVFLVDILNDKSITIQNINTNCNFSMMY